MEFDEFYAHVVDRVQRFDPATNRGPGKPGPVKLIEVGYQCIQSGWVVVVFDTRTDAKSDGTVYSYIEGNSLERPRWLEATEAVLEEQLVTVIGLDGVESELPPDSEVGVPLGEMIKAVLLKARADGVF